MNANPATISPTCTLPWHSLILIVPFHPSLSQISFFLLWAVSPNSSDFLIHPQPHPRASLFFFHPIPTIPAPTQWTVSLLVCCGSESSTQLCNTQRPGWNEAEDTHEHSERETKVRCGTCHAVVHPSAPNTHTQSSPHPHPTSLQ